MNEPSKFDPRGPLKNGGPKRKPLTHLLRRYKVEPNGCWVWTGTRNKQGYGVIGISVNGRPAGIPAPRVQWMHSFGEIEAGQVVMHACDNPPCINPDHLQLGTQGDNLNDMRTKGRANLTYAHLVEFHEKVRRGEAVYTPHLGPRKKAAT